MRRIKFNKRQRENKPRINNQIGVPEVHVVAEDGAKLGVMKTQDAIQLARDQEMDLIEIAPKSKPPVVKIMSFGKFMYEKTKKEKGKKQIIPAQEMKTVRIGLYTGAHDLEVKAKQADRFLKKGHPVRIEMFLRGREKRMKDQAKEQTVAFPNYVSESHIVDGEVKPSPRGFLIILRPQKNNKIEI